MLPTLLAHDIQNGLKNFIITGFETPTPYFQGMFSRFVEGNGNLYKGPYLSIDLPFQQGTAGTDYFRGFTTAFPPFLHQQNAWQRLKSTPHSASTIIATGTGSGKTECFLYPVLDHCLHHPGNGIKAIIIYPMNALATDQAKRFADAISNSPALKGKVRVGLFVGDSEQSSHKTMGPDHVITDKNVQRQAPPDILLTNYKMLDYLLLRPKDLPLWRYNQPETLRYLIVDELHTFDGAQGTDLACLIRRLKARLETPQQYLVSVGTSATLGSGEEEEDLLVYAEQIFQEPFGPRSVIGEQRQSRTDFLENNLIEYQFFPPAELAEILAPERYQTMTDYIAAQFSLLFEGQQVSDPSALQWRAELGSQLKKHILFSNLLHLLVKQPRTLDEVATELSKTLPPGAPRKLSYDLLNSLCALISHARDEKNPDRPLLQVRLQYWVRELRRMVTRILRPTEQVELLFADDLKRNRHDFFLPLVHCNECHTIAWIGHKPPGQEQVKNDLRAIYNAFFQNSPETVMLLPLTDAEESPGRHGITAALCPACGQLQQNADLCQACGEDHLVRVFEPNNIVQQQHQGGVVNVAKRNCPRCLARNSMIVFGSRAASLSSVAIHHGFATPYNDDKKLLAFSDSVQDAAHRAGFFSARTWQTNMRMAIAQTLAGRQRVSLPDCYRLLPRFWRDTDTNPRAFDDAEFICQFIAPNMLWYNEYQALLQGGQLSHDSRLLSDVSKRIEWEILAEFGYRQRIGRSLVATGTVVSGFEQQRIDEVAALLLAPFQEEIGIRDLSQQEVVHFLLGLLLHLQQRGAVYHRFLESYIEAGGRTYLFNQQSYLPSLAPSSASPVFLTNAGSHREFDTLTSNQGRSWYQHWCEKALGRNRLLPQQIDKEVYQLTLTALVKKGVLLEFESQGHRVWGINPEIIYLSTEVGAVATSPHSQVLHLPEAMTEMVAGMPSLQLHSQGSYQPVPLRSSWLTQLYRTGEIHRVIGQEHTGLLDRDTRQRVEQEFIQRTQPWHPNLLSATPTLEMGIDIGDLSSVLMCSVPPAQANYLQRMGRAGRKDGNAFAMTVATGAPHDLYFYADPLQMMAGRVEPPGVFLNATAVVERQLTAYCLDHWVRSGVDETAIPKNLKQVLDTVEKQNLDQFPYNFLAATNLHAHGLYEGFTALFAGEFSRRCLDSLKTFIIDAAGQDGLEMRLVKRLHELVNERKDLKARIDALKRSIETEEKKPQDEATQSLIEQMRREREGLQDILRSINGKQTLNFFTDEGLIPNYAFPEAGVSLRSVIYRKREQRQSAESKYINEVYEYERPGAAAISELAPNNRFFAGGRRVTISQINLKLSEIETWRFCPRCSYAQNLATGDRYSSCPRCGDAMWADTGQTCQMVRLRQVMANTSERDSRIGDDTEDREPVFYSRQMLADFQPEDVEKAWRIAKDQLPFGFEYIRKTTFREMNFGEYQTGSETTTIAGVENVRPGFRVCRFCGMVHTRRSGTQQNHAFTCKAKDKQDQSNLIDCLYLYREFISEAVRILLPMSVFAGSERYLNSFIAAIQLGLKKTFGGKVDHLRMMAYTEPMAGSENKRQFLLLYDSVPGGTGYLHDLLNDHQQLLKVFRQALEVMTGCACNQDQGKDGCYRCLLAYRNSYGMESTSRQVAVELLSDILELEDQFEPTTSISTITTNPLFDSELEARFVEAVKRMSAQGLQVQIQPQVVRGKPGCFLQVNEHLYTIEPQVKLGAKDGAQLTCQPDFYICSARQSLPMKPICVFLDGLKYHKEIVSEDTAKRLSLLQGGQHWVWSLTWDDINSHFTKTQDVVRNPFVEQLQESMQKLQTILEEKLELGEVARYAVRSPLEQLLLFLGDPVPEKWRGLAFVRLLGWLQQQTMLQDQTRRTMMTLFADTAPSRLQQWIEESPGTVAFGAYRWQQPVAPLDILCAVPEQAIAAMEPDLCVVNLHLDDEQPQQEQFKQAWQTFLRSSNLLQFLPKMAMTTTRGIKAGLYETLHWFQAEGGEPAAVMESGRVDDGLTVELLANVLDELREGVSTLLKQGVPVPDVGFELQDDSGEIIAEAELAWPELRIAALYAEQLEGAALFEQQGWMIHAMDESAAWGDGVLAAIKERADA